MKNSKAVAIKLKPLSNKMVLHFYVLPGNGESSN
jgi:hypothetical protein